MYALPFLKIRLVNVVTVAVAGGESSSGISSGNFSVVCSVESQFSDHHHANGWKL